MAHTHTHCWIQYTLLFINGSGYQPYETLSAINAHFSGGQYVEDGVYYGHLSGTENQCDQAIRSLNAFAGREVTHEELTEVIYRLCPINTILPRPDESPRYVGPVMFDNEGFVVRELSETPWDTPVIPCYVQLSAPEVTLGTS